MTQLTTGWGGIPPAPGERRGGELSAARRLLRRLVAGDGGARSARRSGSTAWSA